MDTSIDNPFDVAWYNDWTKTRCEVITRFFGKPFFKGKKLIEPGCGLSMLGSHFSKLGAKVTAADGRQEHVDRLRKLDPSLIVVRIDFDDVWPFEHADLVIHTGLLYHLHDPIKHLREVCDKTTHLVLETEVVDTDSRMVQVHQDNNRVFDQALQNEVHIPSAAAIENILKEFKFNFIRLDSAELNVGAHCYTWSVRESLRTGPGHRRFWFASLEPLNLIRGVD